MKHLKEVRWGIIGVGDVCEVKSGPAFQLVPNSRLVAVMRRNADKARDYAKRHKVPKWYDDADQLINDPEVNAIYIATPPSSHAEYTLKTAGAGKPVYVEKPMARNHQECVSMVDACEKACVPLYVAYYRRALPNFLKVKFLLESKAIGDIRFVNINLQKPIKPNIVGAVNDPNNWRISPEIAGGGYFFDLASHQLDLLDFLFGPISEAKGFSSNQAGFYEADDITIGSFQFKNGILGHGTWAFNTCDVSDAELITIVGSKGEISFPTFGDPHVNLKVQGQSNQVFNFVYPKHIQQPLIQNIVDDLRGISECISTGDSGARTNWVMGQIVNSK